MRRLALAMCAGALGISLVACGGGSPATSEPATTQEASTDATEKADEAVSDETEATAEEDESTLPEMKQSMLMPFLDSFNAKDGMHVSCTVRQTFFNEDGTEGDVINLAYNSHVKGKTLYKRTTNLDDSTSVYNSTTGIWDGNRVSLDEQTHTGKILMHDVVSPDDDENDILWEATPYREANSREYDYDFTVEEREMDGATYTVEVHPQIQDYEPQKDFYFDQDGRLAYIKIYRIGADDTDPEQFFTITSWDKNVDESLLDLSGYEFSEIV
jgi:hypothetical protein